jgi:hypothetical protein
VGTAQLPLGAGAPPFPARWATSRTSFVAPVGARRPRDEAHLRVLRSQRKGPNRSRRAPGDAHRGARSHRRPGRSRAHGAAFSSSRHRCESLTGQTPTRYQRRIITNNARTEACDCGPRRALDIPVARPTTEEIEGDADPRLCVPTRDDRSVGESRCTLARRCPVHRLARIPHRGRASEQDHFQGGRSPPSCCTAVGWLGRTR